MTTQKMIWVAGMLIPEEKKEARIQALQFGSEIRKSAAAAREAAKAAETEMMLKQGYTQREIEDIMFVDGLKDLERRGFGTQHRAYRVQY